MAQLIGCPNQRRLLQDEERDISPHSIERKCWTTGATNKARSLASFGTYSHLC